MRSLASPSLLQGLRGTRPRPVMPGIISTRASATASARPAPVHIYYYFINERGDLYHLYDIGTFLPYWKALVDEVNASARVGEVPVDGALCNKPSYYYTSGAGTSRSTFPSSLLSDSVRIRAIDKIIPSGPCCLKEPKFLDFFFTRLYLLEPELMAQCKKNYGIWPRSNDKTEPGGGDQSDSAVADPAIEALSSAYPPYFNYVSLCGQEVNIIAAVRDPIVFHSLKLRAPETSDRPVEVGDYCLHYAGSLTVPFVPELLRVDQDGYLYHPLSPGDIAADAPVAQTPVRRPPPLGLLGASVGLELGLNYINDTVADEDGLGRYIITWGGAELPIKRLG